MKQIKRIVLTVVAVAAFAMVSVAQESTSSAVMRRGGRTRDRQQQENTQVTTRMQNRLQTQPATNADMSWMKVIYRSLDLTQEKNAPLYFPEQPTEGEESLFRIIMRLLADGKINVYEYLDGREVFTDQYKLKVRDILDRFHIYYQEAKGSSEKHPKFTIDESDVPANEVLSYYIVERWEFDNRTNRMRTRVEAICPVLHRSDDFGMETVKYPMFWLKFDDIRPYLSTQNIFVSDDNNLPTCTYDDYFQLGLYDGEIYKTRNLRNKSMAQLYPDADAMKRAQDSIQNSLDTFEKKLWVPSLDELAERREAKEKSEALAAGADTTDVAVDKKIKSTRRGVTSRRGSKESTKPSKVKRTKTKAPKTKSAATRSVRNRKR